MYEYENFLMESILDGSDDESVEETYIDPEDDMSILEAMADIEIEEKACASKKEGKDVCEKCGKPVGKCECAGKTSVKETDDDDDF